MGKRSPPVLVAHRGGAALRAENTFSAFRHASEIGCFAVETDIQMSLDGHWVCWHDSDLARVGQEGRSVGRLNLRDLKRIDCSSLGWVDGSPEPILLLPNLLPFLKEQNIKLFLEIKPTKLGQVEEKHWQGLLSLLGQSQCELELISFDLEALDALKKLACPYPMCFLIPEEGEVPEFSMDDYGCSIHRHPPVAEAKSSAGMRNPRLVYTCRSSGDYELAWSTGAEVWMCDDPLQAKTWLEKKMTDASGVVR